MQFKLVIAVISLIAACSAQGFGVKYCTDIYLGGYCVTFTASSNLTSGTFYNSISSINVGGTNVLVTVYPGTGYTGTPYSFIYTGQAVNELFSYGLNDQIESWSYSTSPFTSGVPAVVIYSDDNYEGKSAIVSGSVANIASSALTPPALNVYGSFPNDAMSSYVMNPLTKVAFYSDINYQSLCYTDTNPTFNLKAVASASGLPSCMNDQLSSIITYTCTSGSC